MSRPLWRAVASSSRVLASSSAWASPSRPFSLSRAALGHPTRATRYPRWINPKSPPADDDVRIDAPEDEAPGSAPPSHIATTAKPAVPPTYTPLLALPIARRPLFPGFYKAVVVRDPAVVVAIKDILARGQPYLGAFLLKDENNDADVTKGAGEVHDVGVFAQITSVFSSDSTPVEGAEGAAVSTSSSSPSSASPASASQDPDAPNAALAPTNDLQDVLQSLDVKEQLSKALPGAEEGAPQRAAADSASNRMGKTSCSTSSARARKVFDEELSKLAGLEPAARGWRDAELPRVADYGACSAACYFQPFLRGAFSTPNGLFRETSG
ncbi:hypothetical protein DFH08DRAFT_1082196 [Mycena albidolilacea]|uniref:Lon N-terminal domain-containing protein n=1 Tax=Mycena albidolilacea TaxID=1033008 RepID=A0AAD6ZUK8_9AGAR|nr:hypothetical protein DFH08DRAFT_1082196 [Mycena albidolilacea]